MRSLVFPILFFPSISLHWSLKKAFLSLAILWKSAFKWVYLPFLPLPFASLLFTAICKASSDNHFASKVMFKILPARLQQYMNHELQDVQAGFRKGRGTRNQIANICWIIKKQESSRKTSGSALLTTPKLLTVWITTNCGIFLKRWEYQTTWPASREICMQVKKQQWTGRGTTHWFQTGKGVRQGCLSPCLFNLYAEYIMRNAGLDWSTSWSQDCREKYQ